MTCALIDGLGNKGRSHALAHHTRPDAEIVALVKRTLNTSMICVSHDQT